LELLHHVAQSGPEVSSAFYQQYFLSLLQDILYVLTDTFHKSAFKLQAEILMSMFAAVEAGYIRAPLWNTSQVQDPAMTNQRYLREFVANLLATAFPNVTPATIRVFVLGLFDLNKDLPAFKHHIRDFLIQLKEFSGDNTDLFIEEKEKELEAAKEAAQKKAMAIPGMLPPNLLPDEMND